MYLVLVTMELELKLIDLENIHSLLFKTQKQLAGVLVSKDL